MTSNVADEAYIDNDVDYDIENEKQIKKNKKYAKQKRTDYQQEIYEKKKLKKKNYWPVYVYIVLWVINIIVNLTLFFYGKTGIISVIISFFVNLFFFIIIFILCKERHPGWAWFVLLIPFIIAIFFIISP